MNFRNISSWCIRNPVPPIVLFIGLMIAGLVAFRSMDVNNNPDIDFPGVSISIVQPGAAPSELETQVTQRVEAAVRSVSGVDEINSTIREGNSQTFVQFVIGTSTDRAVNDVRDAISQIRSDLPDGILEPRIAQVDIAGEPILFVAVETSDMSLEQLSWYIDNFVSRRLLGVEGVAAVSREGGVDREIKVILDPVALQAQGISAAQVNAQLRQTNLNTTGGRAEIAGSEQSVRVLGNAVDAYALSQTDITVAGGRRVRLADIASVRDSYSEQRTIARMNGRQVVSFNVSRAKGASEVTSYDQSWAELRRIERDDPRIRFSEIVNEVDYTKAQYTSAMEALVLGALLAVLVVFLFLRDGRATAISALAIPLSAIPSFWFMTLLGINFNGMSLLAMSLVAGILVDDAIVEIENIVRHMRMGKSAWQAAIDAADEIGLAVLATTMAIVAVFLPVALMPGVSGQFFMNFGYTVVVAVLMSLLAARMITPLIAAYFLKPKGERPHAEGWAMRRYLDILRWTLKHRWSAVVGGLAALIATVALFATLSITFQPTMNLDFSTVRIFLPPGTTLDQTAQVAERAARLIEQDRDVDRVFERINVGTASLNIVLKKERSGTSIEFEQRLRPALSAIADARVVFQSQSGGGPGTGGRDIMLYLGGDDPEKLSAVANRLAEEMQALPELRAPRVLGDVVRPEMIIRPRLDLAADLGVTTVALSQAIRIATLGDIAQNSAKFSLSDRQVPIIVAMSENSRRDLATIENLPVPTSNGGSVPLKSIADIGFGAGPTVINRTDQIRRTAVGADLAPGFVSGDAWAKIAKLPTMQALPQGVVQLKLGEQKWQAELIYYFLIAVISGVLLVFAVLVLLYRRFLVPFVNMGSLLLAPLGAGLALHATGIPLSMPVLIGLLMLFGIVAKNSILLVDFAIEEIDRGTAKDEAILEAGHKRAQPIVMTSVAMVAGMLPIALSLSGDASWRSPMAVTVMGGLIFSTILTLLIVPALFSIAIDFESWLGRRLRPLVTHSEQQGRPSTALPAE